MSESIYSQDEALIDASDDKANKEQYVEKIRREVWHTVDRMYVRWFSTSGIFEDYISRKDLSSQDFKRLASLKQQLEQNLAIINQAKGWLDGSEHDRPDQYVCELQAMIQSIDMRFSIQELQDMQRDLISSANTSSTFSEIVYRCNELDVEEATKSLEG